MKDSIKNRLKKNDFIFGSCRRVKQIYNKYCVSDISFIKKRFREVFNREINLENPQTFNEKLQWLKLYDRNPLYTNLVDKYKVRRYISKTIGEEYLIPLIGVWDKFEEIDFLKLPNKFVLKCTHDSGGLVICRDKNKLDIEEARKKINKSLKRNFYYHAREWPYKNVKPRIICEKLLHDEIDEELKDYRFFCFNGEPRFVAIDFSITDKSKTRRNLYDLEWNLMDGGISYPRELSKTVKKPNKLNEMINLSKILSKGIPHVRVDFYYINENIYFGEMTFYHQSGFGKFQQEEFAQLLGTWIELPEKGVR